MNLWQSQVSALAEITPPMHAHIKTSLAGQAVEREKVIIELLKEHGPQDAYWLADKMGWTTWGTRRRLNMMLKQGKIRPISLWPRKFASIEVEA